MLMKACPFKLDDLQIKESKEGDFKVGIFSGYASTFGNRDRDNDVIDKGAFGPIDASQVKLLWQHDMKEPIGVWKRASEDAHGLAVVGELCLEVQRGKEAYALMKQGALSDMSIGFKVPKGGTYEKTVGEGESKTRLRHIKTVKPLVEISVVTMPANPEARIGQVKSLADMPSLRVFEAMLREQGFEQKDRAEIAAEYKALLRKCDLAFEVDEDSDKGVDTANEAAAAKNAAEAEAKANAEAEAVQVALKGLTSLLGAAVTDIKPILTSAR